MAGICGPLETRAQFWSQAVGDHGGSHPERQTGRRFSGEMPSVLKLSRMQARFGRAGGAKRGNFSHPEFVE